MRDTTPEAARVQAEVHRRMGESRRFGLACQMSDEVRSIARARIRSMNPTYGEAEVQDELMWELYGFRRQR